MTLADAALVASGGAGQLAGGLIAARQGAQATVGVLTTPVFAAELPGPQPRAFIAGVSDPRNRMNRAARAQESQFRLGPNDPRRGVSEVGANDPRLIALLAFARTTWVQILSRPIEGRSRLSQG